MVYTTVPFPNIRMDTSVGLIACWTVSITTLFFNKLDFDILGNFENQQLHPTCQIRKYLRSDILTSSYIIFIGEKVVFLLAKLKCREEGK